MIQRWLKFRSQQPQLRTRSTASQRDIQRILEADTGRTYV